MKLSMHASKARRPLISLCALAAMLLMPSIASEAEAKRVVHKSRASKGKVKSLHRSAMQQRVRKQQSTARLKQARLRPQRLRLQARARHTKRGRVLVNRGPLRRRAQRRSSFSRRAKHPARSFDKFGRWTRHDSYSVSP